MELENVKGIGPKTKELLKNTSEINWKRTMHRIKLA